MSTIRQTLLAHVRVAGKGKSTNQLAGELGIDVAALHRWITGERSISIDTAEHLAAHFGLALLPAKGTRKRKA